MASCQVTGTTNSVAEYPNQKIKIFPNPTADYLMLPSDIERSKVGVYNSTGQLTETVLDGNLLDLTNQPSGIYHIRIYTEGRPNFYTVMKY